MPRFHGQIRHMENGCRSTVPELRHLRRILDRKRSVRYTCKSEPEVAPRKITADEMRTGEGEKRWIQQLQLEIDDGIG